MRALPARLRRPGFLAVIATAILTAAGVVMSEQARTSPAGQAAGYWLWYTTQETDQEKNGVLIDERGKIQSQIQTAEPGRRPRALGWYALDTDATDPDVAAIGKIIRDRRLVGGTIHRQPVAFGMRSKVFSIKMDGQEARHDVDLNNPTPPELQELEGALLRLYARLEKSPLRTFEVQLQLTPDRVKPGDTVRLELQFLNRGRFATEFRNPASFGKGGTNSLRVQFFRVEKGKDGQDAEEFDWELDVAGHELLLQERKSVPSGDPLLKLAPGGSLRVWTTFRAPAMPPGAYTVQGAYYSTPVGSDERKAHNDLVAGDFRTDLASIVAVAK